MALHVENLGRQVLGCAAEGLGCLVGLQEFGQAEVCQFYVAAGVHQDILGLEVSVDDIVGMEVAQGNQNLGRNELDGALLEPALVAEVVEEVAALDVLQKEVNPVLILEDVVHREDEGVLRLEQNVLFRPGVDNLPLLYQYILIDSLHRIFLAVFGVYYEEYLAEGAFVDQLLNLEIF